MKFLNRIINKIQGWLNVIDQMQRQLDDLQKDVDIELEGMQKKLNHSRNMNDTLATAIIGEFPKKEAIMKYCEDLEYESDRAEVLRKFFETNVG